MRFKATLTSLTHFTRLVASLSSLGHIAWLRLDSTDVRFTVIPETGSQVWSVLPPDTIFEEYTIQSAAPNNTINLEVPMAALLRALRSASQAVSASIRLTKKDGVPLLSLTIYTVAANSSQPGINGGYGDNSTNGFDAEGEGREGTADFYPARQDRETIVTQDIPIRVLAPASVEGLHEPRCRDPDVHIVLPNLAQLKSISDRFTRLAMTTKSASSATAGRNIGFTTSLSGPKLELSANMHGCLRLSLRTDSMNISSLWTGLENPELDPDQVADGLDNHPSTIMKALGDSSGHSEEGWASVRVEGRDWGRVLSVGRLGGRVIACFVGGQAVVLYVFLGGDGEEDGGMGGRGESVLTYYISSFSA